VELTQHSRVDFTGEAADLLRRLTAKHGPLMFHQSGGCCDGSAPTCYPAGELITGGAAASPSKPPKVCASSSARD
jgi:uncharacterized protein (DUF779 family)